MKSNKNTIRRILAIFTVLVSLLLSGCANQELRKQEAKLKRDIAKVKAEIARLTAPTASAATRTALGMGDDIDKVNAAGGGWLLKDNIKELAKLEAALAQVQRQIKEDKLIGRDLVMDALLAQGVNTPSLPPSAIGGTSGHPQTSIQIPTMPSATHVETH